MIRNKSIFSIIVILVFLIADNLDLKSILGKGYYFRATVIYLAPAVIGILSLFFFHQPRNILNAIGIDKGFLKGLKLAFLFTLPMLIGYALLGNINTELTFRKFYWGVILAAFAEELFFRGFLFGQLFRFGGWGFIPAGLLSALIFGSMHLYQANDWGSTVGIFAMTGMGGMWFAWLYIEWNKNLWLPIFLHFFMNGYWIVFGVGANAGGGVYANVFRTLTIIATIVGTYYLHKKRGKKNISKSNLWTSSELKNTKNRIDLNSVLKA